MNERIKKLAVQAGATLEKGYIELSDGQFMLSDNVDLDKSNMDLEKFALMILKECVKLRQRNVVVGGVSEYNRGRRELAEDILKHFGV